jgi:hypothetical protein
MDFGSLDLRPIPRTVIDNQHSQHTENRDRYRHRERAIQRRFRMQRVGTMLHDAHDPEIPCAKLNHYASEGSWQNHGKWLLSWGGSWNKIFVGEFLKRGRHPPFNTAPVADSQRSLTRCSTRAHARIAKGDGPPFLFVR